MTAACVKCRECSWLGAHSRLDVIHAPDTEEGINGSLCHGGGWHRAILGDAAAHAVLAQHKGLVKGGGQGRSTGRSITRLALSAVW